MSDPVPATAATTTRLSGNWLLKHCVFLVVLLVFGFWGLADALYFYPRRGLEDASFKLRNYLAAAAEAGRLTPAEIAVTDPNATLASLAPRAEELHRLASSTTNSNETRLARFEFTKFQWLESLQRVWRLTSEPQAVILPGQLPKTFVDGATRTVKFDPARGVGLAATGVAATPVEIAPQRLLGELAAKWDTKSQVKALSGYDMPLQWVFVTLGFGGGLWMLLTFFRAASTRYSWEPETQTLSLPRGVRFGPADVKEFDKRRWHKFFVTVHLKDGTSHTLDLLRFVPLEEWVLAMERTAFPDSAPAAAPSPAPAEPVAMENQPEANPNQ